MGWGGSWLGTGGSSQRANIYIYICIYIYIYYIYNIYIYIIYMLYITPIIINLWSSELVTSKHQQWIQLIMDITNNTTKWTHIDERCGHLLRQWSVFGNHVAPMCLAIGSHIEIHREYICIYIYMWIWYSNTHYKIMLHTDLSIHPSIHLDKFQ